MTKYFTNGDKILQAILDDKFLSEFAEYNPSEFETLSDALNSENPIVCAIAKIIDGSEHNLTEREIYNDVSNYLKQNL